MWLNPGPVELSLAFNVSYDKVSNVPTLMQAGYVPYQNYLTNI